MKLNLANGITIDVDPVEACSPSVCRSCSQQIFWVRTQKGKLMPAEFMGDSDKAISHFATCPEANNFRKNK